MSANTERPQADMEVTRIRSKLFGPTQGRDEGANTSPRKARSGGMGDSQVRWGRDLFGCHSQFPAVGRVFFLSGFLFGSGYPE